MKILKILIIILLIAISIIGYLAYKNYDNSKSSEVILKPQYVEFKKKPQDAGGIVIASANSIVYERLKSGNDNKIKRHILPEPEAPIQIIYDQLKGDKAFNSIDEILEDIGFFEEQSDHIGGNMPEEDLEAMPNILNGKKESEDLALKFSEREGRENERFNPVNRLNIVKAPESAKKLDQIQVHNKNQEGGYKLQLATAFSESEARKEWDNIKQKYAKILQDADLILRKVEGKNDRIFYLVMAGTYNSLSQAKLVCGKLVSRHQNCIIVN